LGHVIAGTIQNVVEIFLIRCQENFAASRLGMLTTSQSVAISRWALIFVVGKRAEGRRQEGRGF
jgi:hypothetical protein